MVHPGYQLNPGDMFQVDIERVMFATGARKNYWERRFGRQDRRRGYGIARGGRPTSGADTELEVDAEAEEEAEAEGEVESTSTESSALESSDPSAPDQSKNRLRDWLEAARHSLIEPRDKDESAAHKRALRDFTRTMRKELGYKASRDAPINEQIVLMAEKLSLDTGGLKDESKTTNSEPINNVGLTQTLRNDQERLLKQALQQMKENPLDYTKGYKTPWEPRPYMSAFAFIPRYLEVHAPICSAIYLRHPIARPGLGEVPTPHNEVVNGLTFNWYLTRR